MGKNFIISILSVIVMQQSGFITPSNPAAAVLAPVAWYLVIMFTLICIDEWRRARKKPHEAATSLGAHEKYHSYIVNKKGE